MCETKGTNTVWGEGHWAVSGTTGKREEADKVKVNCGLLGGDAQPVNTQRNRTVCLSEMPHNFSFSLVLLKCFLSMLNLKDNFNWVQLRETQQDIHPGSFFLVCWVSYEWPFKNMCYCDYVLSPIFMAAVFHTYIWPIRCLIIKKWQEKGSNLIFNGFVLCFYKTQISWRSIVMCHTSEVIPHQNGFSSHRGTIMQFVIWTVMP